ncbi:hypothetical protein [Chryseobacterium kimseyorum]|nr:hypothetical protein [Chryseobacterium kimseyorum]
MSKQKRHQYISSNLESKNGSDLGNLIYHIKLAKVDLRPYNEILLKKLNDAVFPYDIFILSDLLIERENNKTEVEKILSSKIKVWDSGTWSEKFWELIKNHNLSVEKPKYYDFENSSSSKKYNVSEFIETKINGNEIGKNPLLMVNWNIVSYQNGKLIEALIKLDIKQIDITSKNQSVNLYGKSGIDGLLNVTTN